MRRPRRKASSPRPRRPSMRPVSSSPRRRSGAARSIAPPLDPSQGMPPSAWLQADGDLRAPATPNHLQLENSPRLGQSDDGPFYILTRPPPPSNRRDGRFHVKSARSPRVGYEHPAIRSGGVRARRVGETVLPDLPAPARG